MPTPLEIALDFIARGWNPVPIRYRQKKPSGDAWQRGVIDAGNAAQHFNGKLMNIGVILGPSSHGLTDVDLDSDEARAIAPYTLPRTGAIFGRASSRASHRLYYTTLSTTVDRAVLNFNDPADKSRLVELRIGGDEKGAQTVFPGSTHKETGEPITWEESGEPASIEGDELVQRVRALAAYSLIARRYAGLKARHDTALVIGGFLARTGKTVEEIKLAVEAIARAVNDPEWRNRRDAAADAARAYQQQGKRALGRPAMAEAFGEAVADRVVEFLGYDEEADAGELGAGSDEQATPGAQASGQQTNKQANARPGTALPDLIVHTANPPATAKALAALIAQRQDFLFNGNAPVRICVEASGLPRAVPVTTETIRVLAHQISNPVKATKSGRKRAAVTRDVAALYLNGLEGSWGLRAFRAITTAPILSADGSVRAAQGYDEASGLWCHDIPTLDIPEAPTEAEARGALSRLRDFFRTFPFADAAQIHDPALNVKIVDLSRPPGLDESTFLVALLTAVCRQSLELAPAFLVRAPTFSGAGTGKGLIVKAACIISSGATPTAFTSGHDKEEFDKRLTSALIEARPAVFLDNFNAKELKSDILASCLAEYPVMVRQMGQTKMVPLHNRTFVAITGNAIEIAEDMVRRVIVTTFDARMEDPEQRAFAAGFLGNVFTARKRLLADALTIWRWGRQARLRPGRPLGSYEIWTTWCRDPLLALGVRDPVDRLSEIKAADPRRRRLAEVFDIWWATHADKELKASELADEVSEVIDDKSNRRADGTLQFSRQRVAGFLAMHANTYIGGYVLEQAEDITRRRPLSRYRLQKR
jgi:Bifunctional DNA primase/polymerase, N-terminal